MIQHQLDNISGLPVVQLGEADGELENSLETHSSFRPTTRTSRTSSVSGILLH
jgi:hypothetical protein